MKKYVFISNSIKPTKEEFVSTKPVKLTNVSIPCIESALTKGYKVYMGVNKKHATKLKNIHGYDITFYNSNTYRSILDIRNNIIAFKNFIQLLKRENIQVIHCNTPIGGMIGRLGGRIMKTQKIIYTAHGFHFYEGAPLFNRTILKWAERLMARWTDVIITMNKEDYEAAKKFKLRKNGKVYYVQGVGVDVGLYQNINVDNAKLRESIGIQPEDTLLIALGDLIDRKNYETSLKAIAEVNNPRVKFIICGRGPNLESLKKMALELNIEKQVKFLGFRTDVKELLAISDIFLFTTFQEGLPRSMMEAMASGLPCIASNIRGNNDLIQHGVGGYLHQPDDVSGFATSINKLVADTKLRDDMRWENIKKIEKFDIKNVKNRINEIYNQELL